ncbi:MAG TPA: response regulator [Pyrinomonadaceae bacterium]|nr:response regulator [Pyrinomonadaceae bacterium]
MTRRRKLLVADDSLTIQKVVSLTFSDEGLEVLAASSGAEALRQLEEDAPDIVLADTDMPAPGGYELCERIKGDPRLRHIPVVLLISIFESFNEAEARRVGADDVVTKPFQSIKDLMSRVGSLLGGGRAEEEEEPITKDLPPAHEGAAPKPSGAAHAQPPQHWDEPRITASGSSVGEEAAHLPTPIASSAAEVSFADIELDDRMIEAKSIEAVGGEEPSRGSYVEARGQEAQADEAAAHYRQATAAARQVSQSFGSGRGMVEAGEMESVNGRQTFAARAASAAAADDTLLDLGDIEPSSANTEADDFILDLADEGPHAASAATPTQEINALPTGELQRPATIAATHQPSDFHAADVAGSLADAAHGEIPTPHGGDEPDEMPTLITSAQFESEEELHVQTEQSGAHEDEPARAEPFDQSTQALDTHSWPQHGADVSSGFTHEASESVAVWPQGIQPTQASSNSSAQGGGAGFEAHGGSVDEGVSISSGAGASVGAAGLNESQVNAAFAGFAGQESAQGSSQQLSAEAVEAIARRTVELISERVIREIAWEVVPQLAELLIKQRLDEERTK